MKRPRLRIAIALACAAFGLLAYGLHEPDTTPQAARVAPAQPTQRAEFVGSAACASCHASEHRAWTESNHHRAMAAATAATVLGDFADRTFEYHGRTTRFTHVGGRFVVTTENQAGQPEAFEVAFTLGVAPLQQYLVKFPDGRLQTLPFAWDTRPQSAGGQRWFHLYPDEDVKPTSPLFWTRPQQNWDHMCGECHTTDYRKRFSAADARFDTEYTELGNGCESCHGAASEHVRAHASGAKAKLVALDTSPKQIDQCGVCHARRTRLSPPIAGAERMHETWRPELLQDGLYFADGQIHDEVFEVGSFLQSKMAAKGVMCTSCHDPHSARLKAEGNALCTQCHDQRYDGPAHHFHQAGIATQCVSCHMPTRTYMVVDVRRDHRIAVPRPDLSEQLGTPNACQACHGDRSAGWAADAIRQHRGDHAPPSPTPPSSLREATSLAALGARIAREPSRALDPDPWLRFGSATAYAHANALPAPGLLEAWLNDPARSVRHAIAPLLSRVPERALSAPARERRTHVLAEYRDWLAHDLDRAEALVSMSNLELAAGDTAKARKLLDTALQRDPTSLTAHLNLAELERRAGDEGAAEAQLRAAAALFPESADVRHALGLLLVRTRRKELGVIELGQASVLAPSNAQYAYVYGVALFETGQREHALGVLRAAQTRFPDDVQLRNAIAAYGARPASQR